MSKVKNYLSLNKIFSYHFCNAFCMIGFFLGIFRSAISMSWNLNKTLAGIGHTGLLIQQILTMIVID